MKTKENKTKESEAIKEVDGIKIEDSVKMEEAVVEVSPKLEPKLKPVDRVKDSGRRTIFDTGSSKEILEGRGRYDLLPHGTINLLINHWFKIQDQDTKGFDILTVTNIIMSYIYETLHAEDIGDKVMFLLYASSYIIKALMNNNIFGAIEDLAKLYEAGANKYSARDWEKGRPMEVFIDSTLRHLIQHAKGLEDENHLVAALWNLVSCADTIIRLPELALTLNPTK